MSSGLRSFANTNARLKPTVGDTKTNALSTDHMGWLLCDGRPLSITDYAHLFSVIGYSFTPAPGGGPTFNLPYPQGRVPGFVGQAEVPDVSSNTWILGDISGEETHHLLLSEVPAHNHNFSTGSPGANTTANGFTDVSGNHNHGGNTGSAGFDTNTTGGGSSGAVADNIGNHSHTISTDGAHSHRIASNGGDQRHNNIQPTIWIGNLFIYGGRPWVGTPYARALTFPAVTNNYPPQGPTINLY